MGDMSKFFTRSKANEGIKVPLSLPDGTETDEYLILRSVDSDHFRDADAEAKRALVECAQIEDPEEKSARLKEIRMSVLVPLVAGWSFDKELTPENVAELFTEAPQIADAVDRLAAKRTLFFDGGLKPSTNGAKSSSSSASRQKGQKSR